jgi:hypothetical protein
MRQSYHVSISSPHLRGKFSKLIQQFYPYSGFAKAAGTEAAHKATIKVIKGLAATAWRVATDDDFAKGAREEYESERKPKGLAIKNMR